MVHLENFTEFYCLQAMICGHTNVLNLYNIIDRDSGIFSADVTKQF